jgi:16S rRNA (guanine966-N2)-methyltransferase
MIRFINWFNNLYPVWLIGAAALGLLHPPALVWFNPWVVTALGFEAASRGAASVLLVDRLPAVVAALQNNARLLDSDGRLRIVRADAVRFVRSTTARFDLLFLDPPFHQGWFDKLAGCVAGLLKEDGLIYAESERVLDACGPWRSVRRDRAGQIF